MITIDRVDHIGIRVADVPTALAFYKVLGFELMREVDFDDVVILKNAAGVELNLITNCNDRNDGKNVLMDVGVKYAGYTHVALRVDSISETIKALGDAGITITQGPVTFGDGHVSVFVRDPDRTVIELRGRGEDEGSIGGVTPYQP